MNVTPPATLHTRNPIPHPPHPPLRLVPPRLPPLPVQFSIQRRVLVNDSLTANPSPWAYVLATTGVTAASSTVDGPYYTVTPLVDNESPTANPTSIAFLDVDAGAGVVAGTVVIGLPSPGSVGDATGVNLYWQNVTCRRELTKDVCSNTEQLIVGNVAPSGPNLNGDGNMVITLAAGTAIPTGFLRLAAYTVNSINLGSVPVSMLFIDYGRLQPAGAGEGGGLECHRLTAHGWVRSVVTCPVALRGAASLVARVADVRRCVNVFACAVFFASLRSACGPHVCCGVTNGGDNIHRVVPVFFSDAYVFPGSAEVGVRKWRRHAPIRCSRSAPCWH
jgi:hypothetical protein